MGAIKVFLKEVLLPIALAFCLASFLKPIYLYYTLCYKKQIKEIDLLTVGAVQAKLPMYNIQSMKILVPPTKVISDFQKKMNALDEQIEANTMEIQKLNELRSVLLAKLSD